MTSTPAPTTVAPLCVLRAWISQARGYARLTVYLIGLLAVLNAIDLFREVVAGDTLGTVLHGVSFVVYVVLGIAVWRFGCRPATKALDQVGTCD